MYRLRDFKMRPNARITCVLQRALRRRKCEAGGGNRAVTRQVHPFVRKRLHGEPATPETPWLCRRIAGRRRRFRLAYPKTFSTEPSCGTVSMVNCGYITSGASSSICGESAEIGRGPRPASQIRTAFLVPRVLASSGDSNSAVNYGHSATGRVRR
jgi:hypothetical protein